MTGFSTHMESGVANGQKRVNVLALNDRLGMSAAVKPGVWEGENNLGAGDAGPAILFWQVSSFLAVDKVVLFHSVPHQHHRGRSLRGSPFPAEDCLNRLLE